MRKRTFSRENALKILYAIDITKEPADEAAAKFWESNTEVSDTVKDFAEVIVHGVEENKEKINEMISECADNWKIERMAAIDRNIMRIATYELLFTEEVPPKVAINEAIEMAKKFGDKDSSKFVNGILDKISKKNAAKK